MLISCVSWFFLSGMQAVLWAESNQGQENGGQEEAVSY